MVIESSPRHGRRARARERPAGAAWPPSGSVPSSPASYGRSAAARYVPPVATVTEKSLDVLARRLGPDRLERDVPLAPMTTFRIGGPADLLYRARTPDELASAVSA